ncbi:DUF5318 family protein [Spirillospora sp. CA-142024]|uniref:DUF5318 family protein n=1 Tax=Spirillospora sp. CA-142024 TaxID=3240036 RepID=UPI003D8A7509
MYRVNVSTRYIDKIRSLGRPWQVAIYLGLPRGASARVRAAYRKCGEFRVYVAEVCQSCAWNHLATPDVLGHGEQSPER